MLLQPTIGMLTPTVAVILLVLALIIFGPGKLPQLGKSLGQGIKEFKDATDIEEKKDQEKKESPKDADT